MDWIQKILENAVYDKEGKLDVTATMKKINEEASKHIVEKEQFDKVNKELDTANETIKTLQDENKDNPELQKAIKDHKAEIERINKEHKAEIEGMQIDAAISKMLSDKKAKYPDLLSGKFDRTKVQVVDGEVIGLDEQMKTIEKDYKDMFGKEIKGFSPANPDNKPSGNDTFESLVANADSMTAEEVAAQFAAMAEKQ